MTAGSSDYMVDMIPAGVSGQTYVVLSRSCTDFTDETIIAGPAILEVCIFLLPSSSLHWLLMEQGVGTEDLQVYRKGMAPQMMHPKCP